MTPEQKQAVLDELASGRHDANISSIAYQCSVREDCSTECLMVAAYHCDVTVGLLLARQDAPHVTEVEKRQARRTANDYQDQGDQLRARIAVRRKPEA